MQIDFFSYTCIILTNQYVHMNNWMQVKVKYTKQLDNGALKRVSEPYLLAAMSFTDAEARIHEELGSLVRGEFNVVAIARYEVHDIFGYDDSDVWYKARVEYVSMDADSGKDKKTKQVFLVSALSVQQATERIMENLNGLMVDFEIKSVIETNIVEIFPYKEQNDGVLLKDLPAEKNGSIVILKHNPAQGEFYWNGVSLKAIVSDGPGEESYFDSRDQFEDYKDEKFLVVATTVLQMNGEELLNSEA